MKRIVLAAVSAVLMFNAAAYAEGISASISSAEKGEISYTIDQDTDSLYTSALLFEDGILRSVITNSKSGTFKAEPERSLEVKIYSWDKLNPKENEPLVFENLKLSAKTIKDALVIYAEGSGTEAAAYEIQNKTGADMIRLMPYGNSFRTLSVNPAEYDTIFIGYNASDGEVPQILRDFLDAYDLGAATLAPFNTGNAGDTYRLISELEPKALVLDGVSVDGGADDNLANWLEEIEY